ncbi:M20 family metallopeptidase [Rhizobium puerariae]|uniref:M20 family metallopeptidase n=1 Tax=Rhizobium puerariae TaxID=1585791 RepID=A0ABV6ARJ9_9HYPH
MTTASVISDLIDKRSAGFISMSDSIWDMPELSFGEHHAAGLLIDALEKEGFRIERGVAGMPTAFVAEFGEDGPVIGLLGEYDALAALSQEAGVASRSPVEQGGSGHGCGHNLLGVGALMAAVAVKDYLHANGLRGRVRYYGCPAEEGGGGKVFMARAGLFDDLAFALTWHPGPAFGLKSYPALSLLQARFTFEGRAAHASWAPHLGRSALDALELMNVGVNFLREHMPPDARIHYAITNAGGLAANVVQADAESLYIVRSPVITDAKALFERVQAVAEGAALMTGTRMTVRVTQGYSNVLLNDELERAMYQSLEQLGPVPFDDIDRQLAGEIRETLTDEDVAFYERNFGPMGNSPLYDRIMPNERQNLSGTTDVGDVSWIVPTGQFWGACFAIGTPFHTWQLVAQGKSSAAHKGMVHTAKAMALTAVTMLEPERIDKARSEYLGRTGGKPYQCPISDDLMPEIPDHG